MVRTAVVVVGAGPAGSAAAIAATVEGAEVILLERGAAGKDKACGDALSFEASHALAGFGVDPGQLGGVRVEKCTLRAAGEARLDYLFSNPGWLVPRRVLDQALRDAAERAGVSVWYQAKACGIASTGERWVVRLRDRPPLEAQAVVLAHGGASRLSTLSGLDGNAVRVPAVTRYVRGSGPMALEFDFDAAISPGYRWDFPGPEGVRNIGYICLAAKNTKPRRIADLGFAELHRPGWRGGWAPVWSGATDVWHRGDGLLSCGDAAGMVDPQNGEGVGAALITGQHAGQAAARYVAGDRDALAAYSRWLAGWAVARFGGTRHRKVWDKFVHG